jgi:hypothetical protein
VDFDLPPELLDTLTALDDFIDREIKPLQERDDNARFFDHRREFARTDIERGGIPTSRGQPPRQTSSTCRSAHAA